MWSKRFMPTELHYIDLLSYSSFVNDYYITTNNVHVKHPGTAMGQSFTCCASCACQMGRTQGWPVMFRRKKGCQFLFPNFYFTLVSWKPAEEHATLKKQRKNPSFQAILSVCLFVFRWALWVWVDQLSKPTPSSSPVLQPSRRDRTWKSSFSVSKATRESLYYYICD